jgi:hypothetical protein
MKIPALILNDYEGHHYASDVKSGKKGIETRMNRLFKYRGDIVICCGETNSVTANAGRALCIVEIYHGREMHDEPEEIKSACIEFHPKRKCLFLRNWRHFSRDFVFKHYVVKAEGKKGANFQGIFEIEIPENVLIIPKPEIIPFNLVNY